MIFSPINITYSGHYMAFGNYKINILKQDLICQQVCTDVAAFV